MFEWAKRNWPDLSILTATLSRPNRNLLRTGKEVGEQVKVFQFYFVILRKTAQLRSVLQIAVEIRLGEGVDGEISKARKSKTT